ncbi:nucleoside deaminase [Candidatus Gottesmanbacteria bacterium]|nr:nucleoside deaminase [Candidatus Gottesmanbacteria bacterium]
MDKKYIKRCIELSRLSLKNGELPFASLVVFKNKIISESENRARRDNDPTHHAEIIVLLKARKILKTDNLSSCIIYSSTEPCPMCSFIIREFKVGKVVFGLPSPVMGGFTRFKILQDKGLETLTKFYSKPPNQLNI